MPFLQPKPILLSQSLVRNYVPPVSSTKYRQQFIDQTIEDELHRYIGGIFQGMDCQPIQTGGTSDHVHTLFLLHKKLTLVKAVEQTNSHSSSWIKTQGKVYADFYRQSGYGAFSVNPSEEDKVVAYLLTQRKNHAKVSLQDEYRAF